MLLLQKFTLCKIQSFMLHFFSSKSKVYFRSGQSSWIGASDIDVEGAYKWTDGKYLLYQNWLNSEYFLV